MSSLVEQLSQLSTLHASGALTSNEFALAKTTILRPAPAGRGAESAGASDADVPAAATSRQSPESTAVNTVVAAVGDDTLAVNTVVASLGDDTLAVDAAVVGLKAVLAAGDDEVALRGALRTLERGGAALCAGLTKRGDARLCADVVSSVGAALHAASTLATRRVAAGLLAICGGCSGVVRAATWSWLFEARKSSSDQLGLALLLESLPDRALFERLDGLALGKAETWREIFSSAEAGMPPQRWLRVLIRLLLACATVPPQLAALQRSFDGAEQLAETLAGFALQHATKQAAVSNASTAAGGAYDAQFGDVGAHAARLLALRLLALATVGPELTPPSLSNAVAALRDASVEGASSVRIGIVGVAGLFGLASQIRAQGV